MSDKHKKVEDLFMITEDIKPKVIKNLHEVEELDTVTEDFIEKDLEDDTKDDDE